MDKRVEKKKLDLSSRYQALTQDLQWDTSYQSMDKVFPYARYEGIRINDWSQWQDPFKMTLDVWWRQQSEKDRRLYAVLDAFAQNNGQIGVSDARYVNAVKLVLQAFAPMKYACTARWRTARAIYPEMQPVSQHKFRQPSSCAIRS